METGWPVSFLLAPISEMVHHFFYLKGLHSLVMKYILVSILSIITLACYSQSETAIKAREHMFSVLTIAEGVFIEDLKINIERSPWEALAYMEEGQMLSIDDLQEAVPDYYYFKNNLLQLKLIDPQNAGEFGTELSVAYDLGSGDVISLINPNSYQVKDSWKILYLDKNYLALDMGDVRVFFIHTIIK